MSFRRRFRLFRWAGIALAATAITASPAQAYVALGEDGSSAAKVTVGDGGSSSGQVVQSSGGAASNQVVESTSGSASLQSEQRNDGFSWLSAILAGSALATMGAAGAAVTRRGRRQQHATATF
jgi:hypothetical protein